VLPDLGIKLEDKGQTASWMFVDPEELRKEKAAIAAEKAAKELAKAQKAAEELLKKSTSGKDYFRVLEKEKWNAFDEETGLPTKTAKGEDVTDQQLKNCKKLQAAQQKKYEKWLASQEPAEESKK